MFAVLPALKKTILCLAIIIACPRLFAQWTDHTSTFRNIAAKSYFRFHYDNDFFTNTDYYYTQGITLEYVHPELKKFPGTQLLWKTRNSDTRYGVTFNLAGYTPTSIKSDTILYGDRPFEGSMSLQLFAVSVNAARQQRLTTALSLGVIGPAALGKEIQTTIHQWTDNPMPKGWQHQIRNDIILNYQLNLERKLFAAKGILLNTVAELRLGTLHDRAGAGINLMMGHINNPYQQGSKKKTSYFIYGQAQTNLIGYDATMQGGLFNRKSPYIISYGDVSRITFRADAGLVLHLNKLYFGYNQSFLTKEFRTGKNHRWGGVSFGFTF